MANRSHRFEFPQSPVANPKAVVGGEGQKYRFTILADGLIRYEWADDGVFEDRSSTFAINRDQPVPKFRLIENNGFIDIVSSRFRLTYDKKPFSANGLMVQVLGNITDWHSLWRYGDNCPDLRGTARTLDEADGRIPLEHGVVATGGYSAIDDSQSMLFEEDGWVGTRKPGNRVDGYLFAYGNDYRDAMKAFFAVSGKPPLLPRWSLGNWWSRYYPYTADAYEGLMDKFKKEKVPLSVSVIDMDWHHVDVDEKHGSGWTGYSWNRELYPDPPKFLDALHEKGLKVTLNLHPADGIGSHEDVYEEAAKALGHDTSSEDPIPFDATHKEFFDVYFDIVHRRLENDGVDFWWIDWQQGPHSRTPGIDPLWMLNHFHFRDNARGGRRPLVFSRYAGPGSHRYPVGFSGDTVVTWASLAFQPEFTATASNIGYGWWSHDIGGHMNGYKNDELATRWVQLGCFSPILRLHSSNNPFNSKEPWSFGPAACKSMVSAMQFRHRMIPYLYTINCRQAEDGLPLVQPLYWEYPKCEDALKYKSEFLFGSELLVVPITSPTDALTLHAQARGWLPPGRYIDIFTTAVYDGDRDVVFHRTLDNYPVLAKEGSIIPLDSSVVPENGGPNPEGIEIIVVVGADGSFELLEDDGNGSTLEEVKLIKTLITYTQKTGTVTVGPASAGTIDRVYTIKFLGLTSPEALEEVKKNTDCSAVMTKVGIEVVFRKGSTDAKLEVSVGPNPELQPTDFRKHLFPIVDQAQIDYDMKLKIWNVIKADSGRNVRVGRLTALHVSPELMGVLLEYVLADERA